MRELKEMKNQIISICLWVAFRVGHLQVGEYAGDVGANKRWSHK